MLLPHFCLDALSDWLLSSSPHSFSSYLQLPHFIIPLTPAHSARPCCPFAFAILLTLLFIFVTLWSLSPQPIPLLPPVHCSCSPSRTLLTAFLWICQGSARFLSLFFLYPALPCPYHWLPPNLCPPPNLGGFWLYFCLFCCNFNYFNESFNCKIAKTQRNKQRQRPRERDSKQELCL